MPRSLVLEARDRVGGRTHGIEVAPGEWVDAGAAYLGERHTELADLLATLGLKAVPTGMDGDSRFMLDGAGGTTRHGRFPPLSAVALGDMFELLDQLVRQVDPHTPWRTPDAERLDHLTAADWAEEHLHREDARLFFPLFLGEMMAADPADVSMLHVAFYLRAGGGISYLNDFAGGAQDSRVDGGAHRVCELLAERLPSGAVHLGEPVLGVDDDGRAVRVRTARTSYDADAVVVAVPPRLAQALDVTPAVAEPRATTRTGRGCAVKVHLVYPEPAWRRNGLSGWSVNAEGPLLSTVDDSPHHGSVGVLTGFVTGAAAHAYATLTRDEQVDAATAQAARIFPDLPAPTAVHVTDWLGEEYSRGCYAALFGPGDWIRLGPHLTHPHGRVHWAGSETSTEFFGLMEGAIRSGRRAAADVRHLALDSTCRSRSQQMTVTSIAPLDVREQFMTDPDLGAGNFLDKALAANPHRDVPFAFSHSLDHRGEVVLKGHSLVDLVRLRDRYAKWYWANGVRAGEPVGIVTAEGLPPLIHFLALSALGAIPALVNDAMAPDIMVRYLDRVGVVGVVADDTTRLSIAYRSGEAPRPRFVALTSEVDAGHPHIDLPEEFPYRHAADDIVALIHSSGTTGIPKSTMLGHRQFWEGKQPRMTRFPAQPYDRLMCLMPHTHAGGLSYFLTATLLGLPVAVMGEWRRTAVEPVMEAFQPTMLASFPRTFVELATGEPPTKAAARVHSWFNTGDSAHYGHIRRLVQLGERPAGLIKPWLLPREAAEESAQPGSQFIDGLGSSEMGMANFGQVTTPETERDDRCVGRPLEGVTAAVLDEDGQEVPDGTVGLLGVKTPSRTPGYWNDPRLTASFESNGWWLTGDLARRDAEGRFYHLDRTVDVIDTETGPVYSLPIEEVLLADCGDLVRDCSVVGVPSAEGARPIAVVQLQADVQDTTEETLLDRANKELANAGREQLAAVVIARTPEDFPLGPTGKVLKRELRTKHASLLRDAR